jgi:tRNA(adenine34) deaminase
MMDDIKWMRQAIEIALEAEKEGNLPVGSLITLENKLVSTGPSRVFVPRYDLTRHAEMEALRAVPSDMWESPEKMCIYTTLEPCLMCMGAILLFGIGRVVFGAKDPYGGAEIVRPNLPDFFKQRFESIQWEGPLMPAECDPLHRRLIELESKTSK